jgi:hypothetical protein
MRIALIALASSSLLACVNAAPRWEDRPVPLEDAVEALLGIGADSCFDRDLLPAEIPVMPLKVHLRPCCAFGYALRPELAAIPVPGVVLQNVTSLSALGPHRYDGGVVSLERDEDQERSDEGNGLVYTCRGGFIDIAHVRDNADWTMFMAPTLARMLETGGRIALPDEGAGRAVTLRPMSTDTVETYGRRRIATTMAEWMAFQLSIWHEIATWYGWSALPLVPERASAFSPEDLYSNALGARLAGGVIAVRAAATDHTYERTLDRWLQEALEDLGAVDADLGMQAADQVDGLWWDSKRRVPDERLVMRRTFDLEMPVVPWTVGRRGAAATAWEAAHCAAGATPVPLRIADGLGDIRFAEFATLEILLDPRMQAQVGSAGGVVTQADFPRIVDAIREAARAEFGPRADGFEE